VEAAPQQNLTREHEIELKVGLDLLLCCVLLTRKRPAVRNQCNQGCRALTLKKEWFKSLARTVRSEFERICTLKRTRSVKANKYAKNNCFTYRGFNFLMPTHSCQSKLGSGPFDK
jgi:hypothetical protein